MTDQEFAKELADRGMRIVIPTAGMNVPWGMIDLGNDTWVNRWNGGSTLAEQLAYCIKRQAELGKRGDCKATICSSRWTADAKSNPKPTAKKVVAKSAKKVVSKSAKKGGAK